MDGLSKSLAVSATGKPGEQFRSRRSPVICTNGIVSSSQPLVSESGLRILREGGNAADAAVSMAAVLAVCEPCSTGIGGDFFCLHYSAETGEVKAVNGSGKSPKDLDAATVRKDLNLPQDYRGPFPETNEGKRSAHTVTVPGAIAGWIDCIEKFGSKPMEEILKDAIRLADEGFPVTPAIANSWKKSFDAIFTTSENGKEMLVEDSSVEHNCRAPYAGEVFKRKNLANVLKEVVKKGKKGFYEGWVAEAIVEELRQYGGKMTMQDLSGHSSSFPDSIRTEYDGKMVYEHPPNGDGLIALIALNILTSLEEKGQISFTSVLETGGKSSPAELRTADQLHAIIGGA